MLEVPGVENRGIVVVERDVDVENHHRVVKLDVGLRDEVGIVLLLGLEGSLVSSDLLDDLEVHLKLDERDGGCVDNLKFLDPAF